MKTKTKRDGIYDPNTRTTAITVGLLFLAATATFLVGDRLIQNAFATSGAVDTGQLAVGVVFITACAVAGAGIGAAMLKVLGPIQRRLAYGYLTFRVLEGVAIIALGAYMLATGNLVNYEPAIYVFTGIAGLMLSYLLYQAKLVPTSLAQLGLVGYIAILLAVPSDVLNIATLDTPAGMLFYVPGSLFEFVLPLLLIARGFRHPQPHVDTRAAAAHVAA